MNVQTLAGAVTADNGIEDVVTTTNTPPVVDKDLIARLVGDAREQGVSVDGEDGLLAQLTKLVVESALEGEMTDHLGYEKHQRSGSSDVPEEARNARNGTRAKTIASKAGPIEIEVSRDRAGTFTPQIVHVTSASPGFY